MPHLTKRAYFLFAAVCLLGIIGQWTGNGQENYWRLPFASLILALLIEHVYIKRSDVLFHRELPRRLYLGRRFFYQLFARNMATRPTELLTQDAYPTGIEGERTIMHWKLASNEEDQKRAAVTPMTLGKIHWDKTYGRVLGLFRLAHWPRTWSPETENEIVPDHLQITEVHSSLQSQGDTPFQKTGRGFELLAMRDYRPGDALRDIDWKATARSGRHTVRVFMQEQRLALTVLIDAGRHSGLMGGDLTRLNHYINVSARIAELAIRNGDEVNLIAYADRPLISSYGARDTAGLLRLRGVLETLRPQPTESNPLLAALEARNRARLRNLVVILTDMDNAGAEDQLLKAVGLLLPKHAPLIAAITDRDIVDLERKYAENWIDPYLNIASHEAMMESRRALLHMRHMGAHMIQAAPDQLDKQVLRYYSLLRARRRA